MHLGVLHHVVGEVAWCVLATAVVDAVEDEGDVLRHVDIERGHCPVALWLLWLLFHVHHLVVLVEHHHACALQLLYRWLLMAHDAGGLLLVGEVDELQETEVEDVVGGDNEKVTCRRRRVVRL